MSPSGRPASRDDFRIAVICALRIESDAVSAMFDEDWEDGPKYAKVENDTNAYTMGRIGVHNVVLAYMPGIGKANAATLTGKLNISFPQIRLGLVVGICGGMPFIRETNRDPRDIDVFLGDVIISTQVAQYDLGHLYSNGLIPIDTLQNTLGRPNDEIRAFLHKIQGLKDRKRLEHNIRAYLANVLRQEDFEKSNYQGEDKDILYESKFRHKHQANIDCATSECGNSEDKVCEKALLSTCEDLKCYLGKQVRRKRSKKDGNDAANPASASKRGAEAPNPRVHFGWFASGDSVVKSADHRDNLADKMEAVGFEMEGSGAWESIPVVVIKSVVDYADSHKSYLWQKYGAVCGAACMKAFVKEWMLTEKTQQLGAGYGSYGLLERQSGEPSGVTREGFGNQSRLAKFDELVDNAYFYLNRRNTDSMKDDFEEALRLFSQAEVGSTDLGSSLRLRIHWGLMTVEKELSCFRGFDKPKKLEHINKAQRHGIEAEKTVSRSSDASLSAQLSLEQHIIEGLKALLYSEIERDVDKLKKSKLNAMNGIDASLKKLREVDMESYNEVSKVAMEQRKKFSS